MEFDFSIFAQAQMANRMNTELIPSHRKKMTQMIDFINALPGQENHRRLYAEFRRLKPEVVHKNKLFYIPVKEYTPLILPEEFRHDSFGLCRGSYMQFQGRYCIPMFDMMGDVMGFTGWDRDEDVKYLDSTNYGYKAKRTTFCGMDMLRKAYSEGYCVVVEGPVCKMYIEGFGINVFSLLGSGISDYVGRILNRFGSNLILIPDADEAGDKLAGMAKHMLPQARVYQSCIEKDVDDTRRKMGNDEIINDIVNLIKSPTYRGKILKRK